MTKEETIKRLKEAKSTIQPFRYIDEAIDYAIKALEQEPCDKCVYSTKDGYCQYDDITETISPFEPCEDCISRQAVLELHQLRLGAREIYKAIYDLPPVTPKSKTGYWINAYPDIEPNPMFMYGICSVCDFKQSISNKLNFCPNCGARMVGLQESEVQDADSN